MYTHIDITTHKLIHTHTYTHTHAHIHTHTHTYIHTHTHTHTYIYIYTFIQTHTYTPTKRWKNICIYISKHLFCQNETLRLTTAPNELS